ncbi:sodium/proline symporter [Candidatus Bipolaricaulota bacterium]|nr:sodium/proline symporter [Candidatus Bipolaricaulota bacterium]TFH09649.1 MAG: sodium/proline symporter [Candidatus Atribacteria bacterium]
MSETGVYILVLALYMLMLVAIGVVSSRKMRSSEDFYVGSRNVGPWVTALSYVAAYFSSVVIIGGGGFGYRFGLATIWIAAINVLVGCTLAWMVLGRRVRQFSARLGTMTIPGFLAERFRAPEARMIAAWVITLLLVIYNVSILKGMGHAFEGLMGMPYAYGVLISCAIIVFYVSLGGYLAVVWTGFFQAWIMGIGLVLLAVAALQAVGGLGAMAEKLALVDPGLVNTPGSWGWAGLISFALITSLGIWGMPQMLARFISIRSTSVLRVGIVVVTVGGAMAVLPYICGAVARVMYPDLQSPDLAIPTLTKDILPAWGAAVFLAGVVAAGMSSFAAIQITASSAVVRDFIVKGLGRSLSEKQTIFYSRIASALIGIVSLGIALRPPALVLVLMAFSSATIASTCLCPILFGLYWRRTTRRGVLASMIGGLVTTLIWMGIGSPFGVHGFIPGLLASFIAIVGVSLFTKRLPEEHLARVWGEERL